MSLKISPSQLVLYNRCQRKYYYNYIKEIKQPQTVYTVRGSVFHKILELFYDLVDFNNYEKTHWEEMSEGFKKILFALLEVEWGKIGTKEYDFSFKNEKENQKFKEETKDFLKFFAIQEAYRINEFLKTNSKSNPWFVANFNRALKPRTKEEYISTNNFHGYLDKTVNTFNKGVGIIDYKTSKTKLPHALDDDYILQLKSYAYLFNEKNNFMPEYLGIYYAKTAESIYYKPKIEDLTEVKKLLDEVFTKRQETKNVLDYPKNEKNHCKFCFYKDICKPEILKD